MLNPFCSTNVYGLATLNTPKEKILILGLARLCESCRQVQADVVSKQEQDINSPNLAKAF